MKPTGNPLYIYLHIHKCAGLTITHHIEKSLSPSKYLELYKIHGPGVIEHPKLIAMRLKNLSAKQKGSLRIIIGHGAYYGIHAYFSRPYRYITFLRDPYARTLSNYAYFLQGAVTGVNRRKSILFRNKPLRFDEWLSKRTIMHDYMTRFLYLKLFRVAISGEVTELHLERVIEALRKFFLVGIVEQPIDQWYLFRALDIGIHAERYNQTAQNFFPTDVKKKDVAPYIRFDQQLYSYFLNHHQPQISIFDTSFLLMKFLCTRSAFIPGLIRHAGTREFV